MCDNNNTKCSSDTNNSNSNSNSNSNINSRSNNNHNHHNISRSIGRRTPSLRYKIHVNNIILLIIQL